MPQQDPYTYPGTEVLINIPGITDPEGWKKAETAVLGARMRELSQHPVPGDFDFPHLQAIHARLVEGFYSWGGQLRTSNTGPRGTGLAHCRPEFIMAEAHRIFDALADPDALDYTRSQVIFFNHLASEAGWLIDWRMIDPYVFAHARTVAIAHDETGLNALIYPGLRRPAGHAESSELQLQKQAPMPGAIASGNSRTVGELDAELQAAIQRRGGL